MTWLPLDILFLEILFAGIVGLVWLLIKFLLIKSGVDEMMDKFLRKINSNKYEENSKGISNYLVWPYYLLPPDQICSKAGTAFFRMLFLLMAIIIVLLYVLSITLGAKFGFEIPTGLAIFAAPVFVEWFIYLSSDKESKEDTGDKPVEINMKKVDYDKLWNRFISTFTTGFSSAYIKNGDRGIEDKTIENEEVIKQLVNKFTKDGCDIIASDVNFSSSLQKFSRMLFEALNKGGNILILAELPVHFKATTSELAIDENQDVDRDMTELLACYFSEMIQKQVPAAREILKVYYYDSLKVADAEKRRILLTSVENMLSENLLKSTWIRNLELLVIINFNDSCLSTISENRQFSVLLDNIYSKYNTLIFTPYRNEIHAGLEHTWKLDKIEERRFGDEIKSTKQYYIGFNFEKWRENWNQIANSLPGHPVASGLELSVLPISEHVHHIHLLETAYTDFVEGKEDLEINSSSISPAIENISRPAISKSIQINLFPFAITNAGGCSVYDSQHFSIIFDSENNSPKTLKKYLFLGTDENFTIIVSKPHLFREYFAANLSYYRNNPLEAIQTQLSKSRVNLSMQLLTLLENMPVDVSEIIEIFNQFGVSSFSSVHEEISSLFLKYFNYNIKDNFSLQFKSEDTFENGKYFTKETYSLNKQNVSENNKFNFLKKVSIVDNAGNKLFIIAKNLLFQNFLPGQVISLIGRPYLFENFTENVQTLQVRKTETQNIIFYKPLFKISLSGESTLADQPSLLSFFRHGKEYFLSMKINEIQANIDTMGYYEFTSAYHSPMAEEKTPVKHTLTDNDQKLVKRNYSACRFLEIHWELTPDYTKKREDITTMLHLMLYESMKVFFPYHSQYITICTDNNYNKSTRKAVPWIFPEFINGMKEEGDRKSEFCNFYIIEDSFADLGVLKALQRNFTYIMKYLYDLCLWFSEGDETTKPSFIDYKENIPDKLVFIKYGLLNDGILDHDLISGFIENHLPIDKDDLKEIATKRKIVGNEDVNVECDFCRLPFTKDKVFTLEDGLHRCPECSLDAIDTKPEANKLLAEAIKIYKDHLGIKINNYSFDFEFATAKQLHEQYGYMFNPTSKFDERKIVGLAWDKEKDKVTIEKGYKKDHTLSIIIHELCHIWQYNELNYNKIKSDEIYKILIEGLPVWTEIHLMRLAGYTEWADAYETVKQNDDTEYGQGFRFVKNKYTGIPHTEIKKMFPL